MQGTDTQAKLLLRWRFWNLFNRWYWACSSSFSAFLFSFFSFLKTYIATQPNAARWVCEPLPIPLILLTCWYVSSSFHKKDFLLIFSHFRLIYCLNLLNLLNYIISCTGCIPSYPCSCVLTIEWYQLKLFYCNVRNLLLLRHDNVYQPKFISKLSFTFATMLMLPLAHQYPDITI